MNFKIGDRIALIDDDLEGKVVSVTNDVITILDQDGFERMVSPAEIIKKKDFLRNLNSISPKAVDDKKLIKPSKDKKTEPEVVDLHFHEIHHTDRGLSNFDKLNIQLDYAMSKIKSAKRKRNRSIVFIHGKGAGVLKTELRSMVRKLENCYYEDADWRKFGQGATTVFIGYK